MTKIKYLTKRQYDTIRNDLKKVALVRKLELANGRVSDKTETRYWSCKERFVQAESPLTVIVPNGI